MSNRRLALGAILAAVVFLPLGAQAQYHSSITFKNGAGEAALVKLVGPAARTVLVPKSENKTVSDIAPGQYYILVRYGDKEENYSYLKGDPFDVEESGNRYSRISITLYKAPNGNLGTHPVEKGEFDKAQ